MPTALLPGIGASIRSVRAARAIARSSARASIRLTFTCARRLDLVLGHDRAGVAADDLGRDLEARELLDDDVLGPPMDRLVAGRVDPLDGRVEEVEAGQDVLDALARRRRVGGVGDVVRVAQRSRALTERRRRAAAALAIAAGAGHARRRERCRGRDRGGHRRRPVVAEQCRSGPGRRRRRRGSGGRGRRPPFRTPPASARRAVGAAAAPGAIAAARGMRRMLSAADAPSQRAIDVIGWQQLAEAQVERDAGRRRSPSATSRMNAPTGVTQSAGPPDMNWPTSPPPLPLPTLAGWKIDAAPSRPTYAIDDAASGSGPSRIPATCRGPTRCTSRSSGAGTAAASAGSRTRARRCPGTTS